MKKNMKLKILKIVIFICAVALIIGVILYIFPIVKGLLTKEGKEAYTNKVQNAGINGIFMIIGLEIAQIFLMFLPGEPVEVVAGMCYGSLCGTILIMTSAAIISTIIYFVVRRYGRRFIYGFCDKRKIYKLRKSKMFKDEKKVELILLVLFLMPGTPKDILVYLAGILPINPKRFIIITSLARFPSVFSSALAGERLVEGDIKSTILVYAMSFIIAGAIILIIKLVDKKKNPENALQIDINSLR